MVRKKKKVSIMRSSAAEYLTFLTATGQSAGELEEDSVARNFRVTASDNKSYNIKYFNEELTAMSRTVNTHFDLSKGGGEE